MDYKTAMEALEQGEKIKLPEWTGYWFKGEDGEPKVFTADCRVLDTPFTQDYLNRTDWEITDGSRDFGGAIKALKAGKLVARAGWNGKGMFLYFVNGTTVDFELLRGAAKEAAELATKIENGVQGSSRYINGHIDMKADDGSLVIGWLASQTDMLAEDWQIVE